MKYTPGPWKAVKTDTFKYKIIAPELNTYPNTIARTGLPGGSADVLEGNSALLAEAPAMYEALKMQHNVIINILTDSQLDTRTQCGETIRIYCEVVDEILKKLK